jgi:hypothetical protein
MATARLIRQLMLTLPARVGLLAEVSKALQGAGIDIVALDAYEREGEGTFLLVTDDQDRARTALDSLGGKVVEQPAVAIELANEPGALADAAGRIAAAGINIEYVYGSAAQEALGPTAVLIFRTTDDARVAELLA